MPGFVGDDENVSFRSCAFHFIVLNDELFLEHFDGVQLLRVFGLSKHDLAEITLTENCKEVEMVEADSLACASHLWCSRLISLLHKLCDRCRWHHNLRLCSGCSNVLLWRWLLLFGDLGRHLRLRCLRRQSLRGHRWYKALIDITPCARVICRTPLCFWTDWLLRSSSRVVWLMADIVSTRGRYSRGWGRSTSQSIRCCHGRR